MAEGLAMLAATAPETQHEVVTPGEVRLNPLDPLNGVNAGARPFGPALSRPRRVYSEPYAAPPRHR